MTPPFKAFFAGIRIRLLALVLLALLPSLGLMLHLAREHRNQITQDVNQNTLRLSRFLAASLERDVQAARIFLSALSHQPHPSQQGGASADPSQCPDFFTHLDIKAELYDAVGVADSTGRILCQVPDIAGTGRIDSLDWFRAARASSRFTAGSDLSRTLIDKVTMDFGFPVRDSSGAVRAVYFCALDLEWMNRLAERLQLPEGAALTVTDRQDRTLVRYPNPELWVGKTNPETPLSRLVSSLKEGVMESSGLDGVVRLYAFSHVEGGELSVRIGIPSKTAYAEAEAAMLTNVVALAVVGLLALTAAWVAGHFMVVRQTQRLVRATQSLAAGDLGARTGMDHEAGEFGRLAGAFDEMAESLEWREAQLRESESERSQSDGRFSEVVERAPDAILGVDADFSLFFCNQGAERMFGRSREELEGMALGQLQGDGAATAAADALSECRERVKLDLARADGTPFRADVSVSRAGRNGRVAYTLILRESET
jgi:PAS domain S-box-containing protein